MPEPGNPFVVGIDLSLTATGLADLDLDRGMFTNVEKYGTKGKRDDTYTMRCDRLQAMTDYIVTWATAGVYDPELVVIEGPSIGSKGGSQFDRSGLWWMVVSTLALEDIPVLVVPPKTRAKYATGNGNSGKDVVVAHVVEQYTHQIPRYAGFTGDDNQCDAIALAAMGARYLGHAIEDDLPETNVSAMSGVVTL